MREKTWLRPKSCSRKRGQGPKRYVDAPQKSHMEQSWSQIMHVRSYRTSGKACSKSRTGHVISSLRARRKVPIKLSAVPQPIRVDMPVHAVFCSASSDALRQHYFPLKITLRIVEPHGFSQLDDVAGQHRSTAM